MKIRRIDRFALPTITTLLLLLTAASITHALQEDEKDRCTAQAQTALDKKDYAAAIALLEKGREQWDRGLTDAMILGEAYLRTGDFEKAYPELDRALYFLEHEETIVRFVEMRKAAGLGLIQKLETKIESERDSAALVALRKQQVEICGTLGNIDRAIEILAILIDRLANDESLLARAEILHEKKDLARATVDYEAYLKKHPDDADGWQKYWSMLYNSADADALIATTSRALAATPNMPDAYQYRAYAYEMKKDWLNAREDYEELLKLDPDSSSAKHALESVDRQLHPDSKLLAERAFEAKEYAVAITHAEEVLKVDDFDQATRMILGRSLAALGEYERAIPHVRRAAAGAAMSDADEQRRWLNDALRGRLGQLDAQISKEAAVDTLIALYQQQAELLLEMNDYQGVIRIDTFLIDKFGVGPAIEHRGRAYLKLGDDKKAEADFWSALRIDPKMSPWGLVEVYEKRGDVEGVIRICSQFIDMRPDDTLALGIRARAYRTKGDLDRALSDYTCLIERGGDYYDRRSRFEIIAAKGGADTDLMDRVAMLYLEGEKFADKFGLEVFEHLRAAGKWQELSVGDVLRVRVPDSPLGPIMSATGLVDSYLWEQASALFAEAAEKGWEPLECHAGTVRVLLRNNRFEDAMRVLETIKSTGKSLTAQALVHLQTAAANSGRGYVCEPTKARSLVPVAKLFMEIVPDHVASWLLTAQISAGLGDLDAALVEFSRALELDPRCYHALAGRSIVYADLAEREWPKQNDKEVLAKIREYLAGCIADADRALEINPSDLWAIEMRRNMSENLGTTETIPVDDEPKARAFLENAKGKTPAEVIAICTEALRFCRPRSYTHLSYLEACETRARAYLELEQFSAAINDLERVMNLHELGGSVIQRELMKKARAGKVAELSAEADAGDLDALFLRARVHLDDRNLKAAQQDSDKVLAARPTDVRAYLLSAEIAGAREDHVAALRILKEAASIHPEHVDVRWQLARTHGTLGDVDWLIANATVEMRKQPDNALIPRSRGWYYLQKLDGGHALEDFNRASELDKNLAVEPWRQWAELLVDPGKADAAIDEASKIIRERRGSHDEKLAWMTKAWAHFAKGEFHMVVDACGFVGEVADGDQEFAEMAYRAAASADRSFAQKLAREWNTRWARFDRRWNRRCFASASVQRGAEIIWQLEQCVKGCADSAEREELIPALAMAYSRAGRFKDAIQLLGETPSPRFMVVESEVHLQAGDLAAALARADTACDVDPNSGEARAQRGRARLARNEIAEASEDFQAALKWAPQCAVAHAGLGRIAIYREQWQAAIEHCSSAIQSDFGNADARLDRIYAVLFSKKAAGADESVWSDFRIVLAGTGFTEKEKQEVRDAADLEDQMAFRSRIARIIGNNRGIDLMIDFADSWLRHDPSLLEDLLTRISGYVTRERRDDAGNDAARAAADLSRARDRLPADSKLHYWNGVVLNRLGSYKEAIEALDRSIELDNKVPQAWAERARAKFGLAVILNQGADALLTQAKNDAEQANRLQPTALACAVIAQILDAQCQLTEAEQFADRAAAIGGEQARPYLFRAVAHQAEMKAIMDKWKRDAEQWERDAPKREAARLALLEEQRRLEEARIRMSQTRPKDFWDKLSEGFAQIGNSSSSYGYGDSWNRTVEANWAGGNQLQANINAGLDRARAVHEVERRCGYYSKSAEDARSGR